MRVLLFAIALCASASAQLWSGVLAPSRAIDWSQAGAGAIINRTHICATFNPGATAAQINTAITACSNIGGGVIFLNAGTYASLGGINLASNVTLRGAGPEATFLDFAAGVRCNGQGAFVCVNNGDNDFVGGGVQNRATWTGTNGVSGTYTQDATSLILSSISIGTIGNLHVGSTLILDQDQDFNTDPGDIYVSDAPSVIELSGHTGCGDVLTAGAPHRVQTQTTRVTSITGTGPWTVGISPGIYAPNWRTAMNPGAFWANHLPIIAVGIENMTLDYTGGLVESGGIFFADAAFSWVKNVRAINGVVQKHVRLYQTRNVTIRDSYFYGGTGSSENYGVASSFHSSDNLVENNIFQHMASATIVECSSGDVFGYNFAADNYYGAVTWQQPDAVKHGAGESYVLWEGQVGAGFGADNLWGTSFMHTVFRSRFSGLDTAAKDQQTIGIYDYARNRYLNVVGNVLGTLGYHNTYQHIPTSPTDPGGVNGFPLIGDTSVFVIGWSGTEGVLCNTCSTTVLNDLLTAGSLMRWGNYAACTGDAACNAVRFVAGENGSSAPVYPGLVSPRSTLPASFYLSAKPSWWVPSISYPPIGPDVAGGNIPNVGGHAFLNPAGNCYVNIMGGHTDGSSGPLAFDANSCYSTSVRPVSHPGVFAHGRNVDMPGLQGRVSVSP